MPNSSADKEERKGSVEVVSDEKTWLYGLSRQKQEIRRKKWNGDGRRDKTKSFSLWS